MITDNGLAGDRRSGYSRSDPSDIGPIDLETEWASWTLLKGKYFIGDGYDGIAEDVRLYDRALSMDEIRELSD